MAGLKSKERTPTLRSRPLETSATAVNTVQRFISAPRIVIDDLRPRVDGGPFPAKSVESQWLEVSANVFTDGHEVLAADVLWTDAQGAGTRHKMKFLGNDRWAAMVWLPKPGTCKYTVEAWLDVWGVARRDLRKRQAANALTPLEYQETLDLLKAAAHRATHEPRLAALAERCDALDRTSAVELLLSDETAELMAAADPRHFLVRYATELEVDVERRAAGFASWYELFPRSHGTDGRHGTFEDVISRLPQIAAMGFDVLYLPPIHPIGSTAKKGRNNTLNARPDDPGSPYAIGSSDGGHDAVHPQLGGIEGFRKLRDAAAAQGLEMALDFAIQCSPEHPWLREHPDWFAWRADGSLRCAENPPKKYEDIVNVSFYAELPQTALWIALRDVVEYWVGEGVKIFRVDNPHTKPLPFWQWMIGDIRSRHPEVLFLSEAFTTPAMMYRLAKVGFTQSYTYFTWRNGKEELTEYLTELSEGPPADFFRPNFFVNTPDINPKFLHNSGRPGFLIRTALATTLCGLWGLYSGFELCEAAALPNKEEYLDSEKYELRPRNWTAPGNIIGEITRLNHLRREHPALQTHLGVQFHVAENPNVLFFSKHSPAQNVVILVAISLDPHLPQETIFNLPLELLGATESEAIVAEEVMSGQRITWFGSRQHWRFIPQEMPFAIWRITTTGEAK